MVPMLSLMTWTSTSSPRRKISWIGGLTRPRPRPERPPRAGSSPRPGRASAGPRRPISRSSSSISSISLRISCSSSGSISSSATRAGSARRSSTISLLPRSPCPRRRRRPPGPRCPDRVRRARRCEPLLGQPARKRRDVPGLGAEVVEVGRKFVSGGGSGFELGALAVRRRPRRRLRRLPSRASACEAAGPGWPKGSSSAARNSRDSISGSSSACRADQP